MTTDGKGTSRQLVLPSRSLNKSVVSGKDEMNFCPVMKDTLSSIGCNCYCKNPPSRTVQYKYNLVWDNKG